MKVSKNNDATFSMRLNSDVLDRVKQQAWLRSEGGLRKISYVELIRECVEREYGIPGGCAKYDARAGVETRIITHDDQETR